VLRLRHGGGLVSVPNVAATFGEGPDTFWGAWREGDVLVLSKQHHVLPDRCVKCNAPAAGHRWEKRLYWHHPLIYLSLLAGALIYVVIALIARKEA
jgi:hypothetical protein